ncbi:MAG TPA: zinc finger domain-containing protein [Armatimonadota bacterium]|jgi:formamidopyrimidine-DNA glycosylase
MIELPEAITLSRQITKELSGRRVVSALRGNAPHKFAFYTQDAEEYERILKGKVVGPAFECGACFRIPLEPGYVLQLGGGGERIHLHRDESSIPKKHQLLLGFDDGSHLSVTVQGWGSVQVYPADEPQHSMYPDIVRVMPTSEAFTLEHFLSLCDSVPAEDPRSVKFLCISRPSVWGVGNGCLHDILYLAGIHPRRRVVTLSDQEKHSLYKAIKKVIGEAVAAGGRDTEKDLYGNPGGYRPILDRYAKDQPCPTCGTTVEAIAFLGGRSYLCPQCQPMQV